MKLINEPTIAIACIEDENHWGSFMYFGPGLQKLILDSLTDEERIQMVEQELDGVEFNVFQQKIMQYKHDAQYRFSLFIRNLQNADTNRR